MPVRREDVASPTRSRSPQPAARSPQPASEVPVFTRPLPDFRFHSMSANLRDLTRPALAAACVAVSIATAPLASAQDARVASSTADTAGALSLEEALRVAGLESEAIRIA